MFIAGESSGDMLAAELVEALRSLASQFAISKLTFFGAGGTKMAAAGVELAIDMTAHSVIGLIEVLKNYSHFKKLFDQLLELAIERKPDVIVCVDFSGFNRRFAHAIKKFVRAQRGEGGKWNPKIVQYVSPQVWASRPLRAEKMARDIDLLLCIFPFEKDWYATRTPNLRVEFVGHPIVGRYAGQSSRFKVQSSKFEVHTPTPLVLLLPGSRVGELKRHLPVMLGAMKKISAQQTAQFKMILPDENLKQLAERTFTRKPDLEIQIGGLADALSQATLAIASTGTVTMECAYFGVPTIALYKTSWSTYQIARRIVRVKFLAMPNLLANEMIFPEFIQHQATPENISRVAIDFLTHAERRAAVKNKLAKVIDSLGGPRASQRAAQAILSL